MDNEELLVNALSQLSLESPGNDNDYVRGDIMIIEKDLQSLVVEPGTTAIFECIVNNPASKRGKWLHNGKFIDYTSNKIIYDTQRSEHKTMHTLKITQVSVDDQGIYTYVSSNDIQLSIANLFVQGSPLKAVAYQSSGMKEESVGVLEQLRNAIVEEGIYLKLHVVFSEVLEQLTWYKNDHVITNSDKILITQRENCATLLLMSPVPTDTDVYYAVSTNTEGVIQSSFCNVFVSPKIYLKSTVPRCPIVFDMPIEIEVFENETMRIICKADYDRNTSILWTKDDNPITTDGYILEDYEGQYIGLKKINCTKEDEGEYRIQLLHKITNEKHSRPCNVIVMPRTPQETAPQVSVSRPLKSVAACVGTKILFDCAFALDDPTYHYVVWYVGPHKVERTNSKFDVLFKAGEYLLYIKKLEPNMAGTIRCELRKALHNQKSIYVGSTTANLAIVPNAVIQNIQANSGNPKIYECKNSGSSVHENLQSALPLPDPTNEMNDTLNITYSRLDEDLYYLHAAKGEGEVINVTCQETSNGIQINWGKVFHATSNFAISIGQDNGQYAEVSVCSGSAIESQKPPLGTLLKIRVKPAVEHSHGACSHLFIEPALEPVVKMPKSKVVHPREQLLEHYTDTGNFVGFGSFGYVLLAQHKKENQHYALKIINLSSSESQMNAMREYNIIKQLRHPQVIQFVEAFQDETSFIIVMEYLWGGELFDRIVQEDHIMEEDVMNYVKQICEGLSYLHSLKIAHLDIKPENIICHNPNTCQVKIIDFGLAMVLDNEFRKRSLHGTRDYMAPEVLNYDKLSLACDMWSLGVVSYLLLSGLFPFAGDSATETVVKITRCSYNYDDYIFETVSPLAKNFIDGLLVIDTNKRMSAMDALQHEWLKSKPPAVATPGHMKRTQENLKTYLDDYRGKWKRAGNLMIALNRLCQKSIFQEVTNTAREDYEYEFSSSSSTTDSDSDGDGDSDGDSPKNTDEPTSADE